MVQGKNKPFHASKIETHFLITKTVEGDRASEMIEEESNVA